MIVTLTPHPALDVSYEVERLDPGRTHRVRAVRGRAGGKGVNVSRVLHERGIATRAIAPVGGVLGELIRADLAASGVPHALLPVHAPSRMTVTVVADQATLFSEPGAPLRPDEWQQLLDLTAEEAKNAAVLVCSGSMPANVPPQVVALARVPVVVDTSGPGLLAAAEAGADVLKPNAAELREVFGDQDPLLGAQRLRAAGAHAVVLSLGEEGMVALTGDGCWRAEPPYVVRGNATGAGDAAVAAIAHGIAEGMSWPERLRAAVAWSAAAVAAPMAGSVDATVLAEVRARAVVREL